MEKFPGSQKKRARWKNSEEKKQYQYNYYQLAQKQGEEIRNIRHDLRNQIQEMQYLLKTGDERGEQVGREMFESLKKSVNDLE